MTNTSIENATLIHNLEILQREIAIEGELQLASIARVFAHHIPLYIEKLRRLEILENEHKADRPTRAYALQPWD